MENLKELKVSALENGTVIDHIPAENLFSVVHILGLDECTEQILFGTNLDSKKYKKKGIIKVSNRFFKPSEINKIALAAPTATMIEIRDYEVVKKYSISVPKTISGFVKCVNPKCITNHEKVSTSFTVIDKDNIKLSCNYCEKITDSRTMVVI